MVDSWTLHHSVTWISSWYSCLVNITSLFHPGYFSSFRCLCYWNMKDNFWFYTIEIAENHLADDMGKINTSDGIQSKFDLLPGALNEQYHPISQAWVSCDSCRKWRRIPAGLADLINESQCTWYVSYCLHYFTNSCSAYTENKARDAKRTLYSFCFSLLLDSISVQGLIFIFWSICFHYMHSVLSLPHRGVFIACKYKFEVK